MKTKTCPDCNCEVTLNNFKRHIGSKQCQYNQQNKKSTKIEESWLLPNGKYQCPHCKKEYTKNGICTHIWRTHGDGQKWTGNNDGYKDGSRKGTNAFIKGTQTEHSEETKVKIGLAINGNKHTDEWKENQSKIKKELFKKGKISGWDRSHSYKLNPDLGNKPSKFYIGLFEKDNFQFIKVGISQYGFEKRYHSKMYNTYTKELLFEKDMTNLEAALLEEEVLNIFKEKYNFEFPDSLGEFHGYSECLTIDCLNDLMMKFKQ